MRKAFTMIELVFMVVIIGVLAAIAIPKLATSREDAEAVKLAEQVRIAISDITAFGLSSEEKIEAKGIDKMTRVSFLLGGGGSANEKVGYITSRGNVKCIKFEIAKAGDSEADGWYINKGDWYLEVTNEVAGSHDRFCKKLQERVSDVSSKKGKTKIRGSGIFNY